MINMVMLLLMALAVSAVVVVVVFTVLRAVLDSEISLKNSRSFLAETKDREEVVVDNSLHKGVKT